MQKLIVKLTQQNGESVLIGIESIIEVKLETIKPYDKSEYDITVIRSRGAMITTNYVTESVQEIYNLINNL
jgi:hypothetical protein